MARSIKEIQAGGYCHVSVAVFLIYMIRTTSMEPLAYNYSLNVEHLHEAKRWQHNVGVRMVVYTDNVALRN